MKKYINKLPKEILNLLFICRDLSWQINCNIFLIGGFVRDLILKVENFDIDIVVEGNGLEFAKLLSNKLKAHILQHKQFGTATITVAVPFRIKIDIATARKEIYQFPASLPQVTFGLIKDDLARRDFSINAMAIDITEKKFGRLIDYFNGKIDLKKKMIRILHNLSFIDDPTRILRAIRFKERYDFKIEKKSLQLLKEAIGKDMLNKVQKQRLRDELILMLREKDPIRCILGIHKLCGLNFIHKNLKLDKYIVELLYEVKKIIEWFKQEFPQKRLPDYWLMYLMVLIKKLSLKDIKHLIQEFAFRKGEKIRIICYKSITPKVIKQLKKRKILPSTIYKLLEPLSYEVILLILIETKDYLVVERIKDFFIIYNGMRLSVGGQHLRDLGAVPGPHFKKILNKALYAKINGKFSSKKDELDFLKKELIRINDHRNT